MNIYFSGFSKSNPIYNSLKVFISILYLTFISTWVLANNNLVKEILKNNNPLELQKFKSQFITIQANDKFYSEISLIKSKPIFNINQHNDKNLKDLKKSSFDLILDFEIKAYNQGFLVLKKALDRIYLPNGKKLNTKIEKLLAKIDPSLSKQD